jgi:hypothetical protein
MISINHKGIRILVEYQNEYREKEREEIICSDVATTKWFSEILEKTFNRVKEESKFLED